MNAVPDAANNPCVRTTFSLDGLLYEEGNEFGSAQEASIEWYRGGESVQLDDPGWRE
jgi:hypothetical protein